MTRIEDDLDAIAATLTNAQRVLCITGAGVSADSGLPTYRGVGGLYEGVATEAGVPIEVALSGHMLRRDPALCWTYIARVEQAARGARPNAAHRALAALERGGRRVIVLTQNVDGLHTIAGSTDVIEIHGNVGTLLCTRCTWRERRTDYAGLAIPPSCPRCGALVRPDVVLFGEMLDPARVRRLEDVVRRGVDVVLSVGTTSVFPYIAGPVEHAAARGVPTVEINPGDTEVSHLVRWHLRMGAADAFTALLERMGPQADSRHGRGS